MSAQIDRSPFVGFGVVLLCIVILIFQPWAERSKASPGPQDQEETPVQTAPEGEDEQETS